MINYTPAMIIYYQDFCNKLRGNISEFIEDLEKIRKELKSVSKYQFDNDFCRFSNIFGTEFKFHINERYYQEIPSGDFNLNIWDYTGRIIVFCRTIPKENRDFFIKSLLEICEKWSNGEMQCCGCRKWISYSENESHHYFAGIYCDECWENKYRAIEAKENYG